MTDRENQALIMTSPLTPINNFLYEIYKSICKIIIRGRIASGFLLKLYKRDEPFYCLMTNEHVITPEMIENQEEIEIYYDNQKNRNKIVLNKEERFIRDYMFLNIDAIVIEILNKDDINDYFFLTPNLDYINDFDELVNKKISITQFPKGGGLCHSEGEIKSIIQYEFTHLASTKSGSSGSPIFLDGVPFVVGIHKQGKKDGTENYGDFIGPIVDSIKKDLEYDQKNLENGIYEGEIVNKKREGYGKYIFNNGNYYIGQFKNGLRNGKGATYYKNNHIMNEGTFVDNLLEGEGKFYDIDGSYYIGQFSQTMKHGKGKDYDKNGNILYEGDFVMNKREGKGKYIYANGDYYIGDFVNNVYHGNGIEYYKNGNIRYEGEFKDNLYDGKGKYICEDGNYYIGRFEKGKQHGKGIEYYKDDTIEYEGDFVNDEREGFGKYVWENGDYYIGQFSKDERNGRGIEYYKNNTIKYEGEFLNNLYEGKGKLIYENGNYYEGEFVGGLRDGHGILYYKDGKIKYKGDFVKGKLYKKMNTVI